FTQCIIKHLAVLGSNQGRQFFLALIEQLAVAKQDLSAFRQRGISPGRKCCFGCSNRFIYGGLTTHSDLPGNLTGCGISYLGAFNTVLSTFGIGVIDPVVNDVHRYPLLTKSFVLSPCPL